MADHARLRTGGAFQSAWPVVILCTALIVGGLLVWQLSHILLLVAGSALFGLLLHTIASFVSRLPGIGAKMGLAIAVMSIFLLLAGFVFLLGSQLQSQLMSLLERLPQLLEPVGKWLGIADIEKVILERTESAIEEASLVRSFAGVSSIFLTIAAEALLVIVGGIYFAADPGLYRRGLIRLLPPQARENGRETLEALYDALRLWLLGKVVAMVLVGALSTLGLWLLGVPSSLALGFIAGLLEFVPFVGPIVSAVPAIIVAAAEDPALALWTAALYLLIQQIEGNLITPLVQQQTVDLPPALTIFSIVAFGALMGTLGVLLAAPLTVMFFVIVKKVWVRDTLDDETTLPGED